MEKEFQEQLAAKVARMDEMVKEYLPKEEGYQKTIFSAMQYSVLAGGKRLRPILMEETYRLFGGTSTVIEPFLAAMEMIHTYSLVHDDLPAMDNDEYRLGKQTPLVVNGEAMGILAGDALLNYAYETALTAFDREPENPYIPKALQVLAREAGVYGMVGGQVVDVETTGQKQAPEVLHFIYHRKTAALLMASMKIGAILAGAEEAYQKQVEKAAEELGMAFQIQDDLLDVLGEEAVLGKPIGSDEKNEKTTYVSLYGIEAARQEVEKRSRESVALIQALPYENDFLVQLMLTLIHREK